MYQKTQLDLNKMEDQILFNNILARYQYHDTFNCKVPLKMKKHYHKDDEIRYFLSGNAKFVVENEVIECKPGTLLEIGKNVVHSFEFDGKSDLKVQRFFENDEEYKEYYVQD